MEVNEALLDACVKSAIFSISPNLDGEPGLFATVWWKVHDALLNPPRRLIMPKFQPDGSKPSDATVAQRASCIALANYIGECEEWR